MLTAHDFAKPMHTTTVGGHRFMFGGSADSVAAGLEKLAAIVRLGVESGGVAVSRVTVTSETSADDFTTTKLVVDFTEQVEG